MHQDRAIAPTRSPLPRLAAPLLTAGLVLALSGCAAFQQGGNLRGGYAKGNTVVAILPGKGPVGDVADAVREGLRAAHGADDTGIKPGLKFLDNNQPEKMAETYKEAIGASATQVIGPLRKPEVDALATGPALPVPTLALNNTSTPGKGAANLYQLALDPESEAIDLARKAKAMGFTRALLLVPEGEAGARRAAPFRRQWQGQGGTLVGEVALAPNADPTQAVSRLLGMGTADLVFLGSDADQAVRVYPALRAKAPALPVLATSAVYSGTADGARDKALSGLLFVDAPWVLGVGATDDPLARARLGKGAAALSTPLGLRLYAMGIDAYRLAPRLPALAKSPGTRFPGATGDLSVDTQGRVQRELTLAQFTAGGPRPTDVQTARKGLAPPAESKPQSGLSGWLTRLGAPAAAPSPAATPAAAPTATPAATAPAAPAKESVKTPAKSPSKAATTTQTKAAAKTAPAKTTPKAPVKTPAKSPAKPEPAQPNPGAKTGGQ